MSYLCRCGETLDRGQRCKQCYRPPKQNGNTAQRGYDRRWRMLSERVRAEQPLCENCKASGIVRPSKECHHIQPIATHPELRLVRSNIMALCVPCHQRIEKERHATNTAE